MPNQTLPWLPQPVRSLARNTRRRARHIGHRASSFVNHKSPWDRVEAVDGPPRNIYASVDQPPDTPRPVVRTALPKDTIATLQKGILNYTYKGVRTWKSPFDLALYQLVLSRVRPRTILEFGTKFGGSALWFADMAGLHGLDCHIYSYDHKLSNNEVPADDRISFEFCDVSNLKEHLDDDFMSNLARPIFIIDDSSHRYEHVLAILEFADRWLDKSDYIVIEDGIVEHMKSRPRYEGGTPLKAITEFLESHPQDYEIDRSMCDFYGTNTTWALDGYIQPLRKPR